MQTPVSLLSLVDEGIVEQVLRPLMSGKEAQVYLVRSEGELRVAKVYKEAQERSFRQRAEYAEGRHVRNSRDQRAMGKRTRHGREQDEAAWRSAEVNTIYRLRAAGVRVPVPYHFVDGVLIMELVVDAEGNPAPRLGDLTLDRAGATEIFDRVLAEVVAMLAAGVVHGDLSDFNILVGVDGPVIIDFPQSVDAAANPNARKLLLRDVDNLHRFLSRFVPGRKAPPFAQEMWQLYERGELTPDTKLAGKYQETHGLALTDEVLALIAEAERDERRRRVALGLPKRGPAIPAPKENGPRQAGPARPVAKEHTPRHGGHVRPGENAPRHGGHVRPGENPPRPVVHVRPAAKEHPSRHGAHPGAHARPGENPPRHGAHARPGENPPRHGGNERPVAREVVARRGVGASPPPDDARVRHPPRRPEPPAAPQPAPVRKEVARGEERTNTPSLRRRRRRKRPKPGAPGVTTDR